MRACVDPPTEAPIALVSLCRRRSTWVYFRPAWTCVSVVFALDWTLRPSLGWTRCTTSRAQIIEYPILYYTIYLGTCSPAARHMLRPDRDREVLHWPCGPLYIARSPVLAALTWLPPFVVLLSYRAPLHESRASAQLSPPRRGRPNIVVERYGWRVRRQLKISIARSPVSAALPLGSRTFCRLLSHFVRA